MLCFVCAKAEQTAAVDSLKAEILASYTDWQSVELNGKLYMESLPVNPSIRIYMERDSVLMISVRVPFKGEIGRIEIVGNELLAINRWNNVYCKETFSNIFKDNMPAKLSNLQDLFLARIFFLNGSTLNSENIDEMAFDGDSDDYWVVLPKTQPYSDIMQYGFITNKYGELTDIYSSTIGNALSVLVSYAYSKKNTEITIEAQTQKKTYSLRFKFDEPKWEASPMQSAVITSKMRQVGIKEFLQFK
jgi:hypothetical protein